MAYNIFKKPEPNGAAAVQPPTGQIGFRPQDFEHQGGQPVPTERPAAQPQNTGTTVQGAYVAPRPVPQYTGGDDPQAGMDYVTSLYTNPQEEERLRKASLNKQRILAVGDALRHIGNIYHTVKYSPSQQFNKPWEDEQARYEKGKAMRDAANARYFSYQQAKAAQDAKQKQWEATFAFNAAKDEREAARKERLADAQASRWNAQTAKDESSKAYWDTRARLLEAGWPLEEALKQARIAEVKERTRLTGIKADQGGFAPRRSGGGGGGKGKGSTEGFYDSNGVFHTYRTSREAEAKLTEFAPEIPTTEDYVKGKDAFGNDIKGNRKVSVGNRVGTANKRYRPKGNANKEKTSGGRGGYGNGTRNALKGILGS